MTGEHSHCLNCGAGLTGHYCSACGQDAHEGRHPTLGHFAHELVHEFLHLDGKIGRTVWALLFQPGRLTREYWDGRILSWIRPVRIFLTMAALNLLLASQAVGPMNFRVRVDRSDGGERRVSISPDPGKVAMKKGFHTAPEAETREFLEKFRKAYASVRYASVAFFAMASWILYRRRQRYFANHLVFGFHYYAAWYAFALAGGLHPVAGRITSVVSFAYLLVALRRIHGIGWKRALPGAAALLVALLVIELGLAVLAGNIAEGKYPLLAGGGH